MGKEGEALITEGTAIHAADLINRLQAWPLVRQVFDLIDAAAGEITRDHITICEIPAPPFGEEKRARHFERQFRQIGLEAVGRDHEGNVIGLRRGQADRPTVILSAHLDTVFPAEVNVRVDRRGNRLCAPGIGDNACGLAALLALAKVLQRAQLPTVGTLVFLATVGEEGEGNLRGVKHFFINERWSHRTDAFIAFDGHGVKRIVHRALGSRRYRITMTGPGGHSWGDFGIVNPVHSLAKTVANLIEHPLPQPPRASLNIGRISGGQSVNSIPQSAWMDVDVRSRSQREIERIGGVLQSAVEKAAREENERCAASKTQVQFRIDPLGERPTGHTPPDSEIVRLAVEATRVLGVEARLECASTDANIPIWLGIPAITLGGGGSAGSPHTLDEWYDPTNREVGIKRALLVALALAGVQM